MSDIITVLETLGRDVHVALDGHMTGLAADVQAAVRSGDPGRLAALIGARSTMACLIMAPDDEPAPSEQPDRPSETPDEAPDGAGQQAA